MPESKTIEIDEVLPAENAGGSKREPNSHSSRTSHSSRAQDKKPDYSTGQAPRPSAKEESAPPFPDIASALGWKARLTLTLTQWFLFLRSKTWGKWVIGPIVVFGILLAIPLAILAIFGFFLMALFRPLTAPRR